MTEKLRCTDDGLTVFRQGGYIGLRDGDGVVTLPPALCFSAIKRIEESLNYIAVRNKRYSIVTSAGTAVSATEYDKIEDAGGGYCVARLKKRYNMLDGDGKAVLSKWVGYIGEIHNGFFIIGKTERKPQTGKARRLYGLAHTDGTIIFSPIFDELSWREHSFFYAEKDGHPYIIKEDGSIIDLTFEHLPVRLEVDKKVFVEKALDWILSGMHIYYRDSEANIDATKIYQVGKVIRAGFFVDVSSRLRRPLTKLRFLICSAHVAPWEAINELVAENPNIGNWGFCTLHCNSYYIVLDIYVKGGVTQVSLLHIPPAVAKNIGESAPALLDIIKQIPSDKGSLVDITRKLLDRHMRLKRNGEMRDEYLLQCMRHPVGLNNVFDPVPLEPAKLKGDAAALGRMVTHFAKDGDIDNFYTGNLEDNFLWHGLTGSVCEGCVYSKDIAEGYRGCGRLTTGSFRRNYMRNACEYRKADLSVFSQAEIDAKNRWSKYQEQAEKSSHVYAKNLVRKFVDEYLDGDIDQLKDFDFRTLPRDSKYIDNMTKLTHSPIIRALMSLIYDEAWPDLTYDLLERGDFECDTIHSTELQLGAPVGTEFFFGMQKLHPSPQQTFEAFELYNMLFTLGNFWVLPNHGTRTTLSKIHNSEPYNGFIAQFLCDLYKVKASPKDAPKDIMQTVRANSSYFKKYRGEHGFRKLMQRLMLDDLLDTNFDPCTTFSNVTWKDTESDFFESLAASHDFFMKMLPHRGARMVAKLKTILK